VAECSAKRRLKSRRVAAFWLALWALAGAARTQATPNPVLAENQRPGSPQWELVNPALAHEIEGYAEAASVQPGETLRLHVSSVSPRFSIEVFRMGWYGGAGARRVYEVRAIPGVKRAIPKPRNGDGLVECAWPVSCRVPVGADWLSGVYLARLTGSRDGKQSFIPFVVREPDRAPGASRRAPILIPLAVNTWQAYNNWGGKSLYDFNSFGGRATRVSFDRPYASSVEAARGAGAGEFLSVSHAARPAGWEYPFVRWIEKSGYDVAYATNLDLHRDSSLCLKRKAVLLVGHDEYWSRAMRDHVERARDRGVHLGIFAANVCYWQVRCEPSTSGARERILFCAKQPDRDPVFDTERDPDLTVRFRNLHPPRPEASLVGMMLSAEDVEGDFTPAPEARNHWIYDGTGIASGRTRSIPGLLGYEVDRSFAKDATYARWSPKGLTVLARAWVQPLKVKRLPTESTIYTAPSGAHVFAAGTMQWSWGLDDWGTPGLRPRRRHPDADRITRNLLAKFLGTVRRPDPRSPG
jgi:hypothetical protein